MSRMLTAPSYSFVAGALVLTPMMRAIRPRSTMSRDSADLIVIVVLHRARLVAIGGNDLLHVDHFADDAARRHDLVAALDVPQRFLVLLLLRLLRPDEQEVEDAEDGDELNEKGRQAPAAAAAELEGEKRGEQAGVRHTVGVVAVRE